MEKQKVKTKGSMVRRKGLFSMIWRERERLQLNEANVEPRFLGNVGYVSASKGYFEWMGVSS